MRKPLVIATTIALTVTACGSPKTSSSAKPASSGPIQIGASLPLSGVLAGFGSFQKWGYEHAVAEFNNAGGISVGGTKRKIKLTLLDDGTNPNQVSTNTQTLISKDNVTALLGSCTPALVIPGALLADRSKIPFVTGCDPTVNFTSTKKWTWAWDLFFAEPNVAALPFQTLTGVQTNKKVAILHDNGPDGQAVGKQAWPALSKKFGYQVVANVEFPTDATDLSAAVATAKASGADVLLVDAATPQAVSLRKQMATTGYKPKFIQMEKGAEPSQFATALGALANGVGVGGYWDPSFPYPGAKQLATDYQSETGQSSSQHIADSYTAAKILIQAIGRAGSTDATAVNTAIGKTSGTYPVGPVKFAADHAAVLGVVETQWQNGKVVVVYPTSRKTGTFLFPVPN